MFGSDMPAALGVHLEVKRGALVVVPHKGDMFQRAAAWSCRRVSTGLRLGTERQTTSLGCLGLSLWEVRLRELRLVRRRGLLLWIVQRLRTSFYQEHGGETA
jgi:hypothetical protein